MGKYDYGKRPTVTAKRVPRSKWRQWVWSLMFFISGYVVSTLYDVSTLRGFFNQYVLNAHFAYRASTPQVAMSPPHRPLPPPRPKLEFYTLLSKDTAAQQSASQTVAKTTDTAQKPILPLPTVSTATPAPALAPPRHDQYTIQLAAFNNITDANHMKAAFEAKGFQLTLAVFEKNNSQWYRVMLGPFSNRNEAEVVQRRIAQQDRVRGMIKKI